MIYKVNVVDKNKVLSDPKKLVRIELENKGYNLNQMNVPKRVFLLADSFYDEMLLKNCATYKYPLGGKLYVFNANENIGFVKSHMCSPAIATQAEDLMAGGVEELIHIGFAGGLQTDMMPGDIVITDGAYNDTAVARLYGYDLDLIESSKTLTNKLGKLLSDKGIVYKQGLHWTTDAGYMETWGQIIEHRDKGALCVEMEGVGLFSVAAYRKCLATAIYVISDVYVEDDWNLGWGENKLEESIQRILNTIISSI